MYTLKQLLDVGGKEWNKGEKLHRIYFSQALTAEIYGLTIVTHDLERIESATIDNKDIAPKDAFNIIEALKCTKVYYDLSSNEFNYRGNGQISVKVIDRLKKMIDEKNEIFSDGLGI